MPFHAEPADAVARWASVTLSCLLEEQHSSAALGAFIESLPATELFRAEAPPPPPPWASDPRLVFEACSGDPAAALARRGASTLVRIPSEYRSSWLWNSLVVDSPRYLDALQASLFDSGATARIEALEGGPAAVAELAQRLGCEIAVNCAGLGGGALGGEDASAVTNGRGVVLQYERASVAGLAVVMSQEAPLSGGDATPAYVIPRGDVVVCGGSYDEGVTADASREEVGRIEASAAAIAPGSLGALRQVWVGHRPVRGAGVRVEVEPRATSGGVLLAHNYGHGGSGWTIAHGCAEDIADGVAAALS